MRTPDRSLRWVTDEFLAAREMLRTLGFTADELIFVISGKTCPYTIGILLRTQGLEFTLPLGQADDADDAEHAYVAACNRWNDGTDEDNRRVLLESQAWTKRVELCAALVAKGFRWSEPAQ
jgi:hypothetical protein